MAILLPALFIPQRQNFDINNDEDVLYAPPIRMNGYYYHALHQGVSVLVSERVYQHFDWYRFNRRVGIQWQQEMMSDDELIDCARIVIGQRCTLYDVPMVRPQTNGYRTIFLD